MFAYMDFIIGVW